MHPEVVGSEQALLLRRFLLPQLKSEQAITQKVLSAVPVGGEDYRPDVKSRNAFELARHLAFTEIWFLDAVL